MNSFIKNYVFYYTEKELQCFEKWCRSLKTNGKPMLDTVLEAVQFLNDESETGTIFDAFIK